MPRDSIQRRPIRLLNSNPPINMQKSRNSLYSSSLVPTTIQPPTFYIINISNKTLSNHKPYHFSFPSNSHFPTLSSKSFNNNSNCNMFTPAGDQVLQQCLPLHPLTTMMEKSWKPSIEIAPNCPRCASSNTKFCYYNNYSLSQPRYFCKGCRRYWTKGGSLRNVPVGGGCRKNRRGKSVRLPHRERPEPLSSSQDSGERAENANGDSVGGRTSTGSSSSYIDMAVVFAKFLNQEPELADQNSFNGSSDSPSCLVPESVRNDKESLVVEELVPDYDPQDKKIEELLGINERASEFGVESFLVDHQHEVEQDVFWSDHEAAGAHDHNAMANFTWPPMVCMQQLEAFPSNHDDHLRFSTNLMINDNSFDLFSGFEVFSRS